MRTCQNQQGHFDFIAKSDCEKVVKKSIMHHFLLLAYQTNKCWFKALYLDFFERANCDDGG